jgi:hypothetical protein
MKTETLNEYLFADLVTKWAREVAQKRAARESRPGFPVQLDAPITTEDLQEALTLVGERRREVLELLEATRPPPTFL